MNFTQDFIRLLISFGKTQYFKHLPPKFFISLRKNQEGI